MLHMVLSCQAPASEIIRGSRGNGGSTACTLGLFAAEEGESSLLCLGEESMSVQSVGCMSAYGGVCMFESFLSN